jgi:enolase
MTTIATLHAYEILDSRGRPTVAVECELSNGARVKAHAPSGASTGKHEAVELRDKDHTRYGGKGVLRAVRNVNTVIAHELTGCAVDDQCAIDHRMIELDGTPNKSELGANAVLAVSCAVARAGAVVRGLPLWKSLGGRRAPRMPVPMVNILSGGLHAEGGVELQDFLAIPFGLNGYSHQLEAVVRIHQQAHEVLKADRHYVTGVADEGGWGPRLPSNEKGLQVLTRAIEQSGFRPGTDVGIAIDAAASHFFHHDRYVLSTDNRVLSADGMIAMFEDWCSRYALRSIEDPLEEDDWAGWQLMTKKLGSKIQIVGDDLFTTNPGRLEEGIRLRAANAVLVKMNQIGTISETLQVIDRAREAGYSAVVSARSGETEDDFLADLAVASGAGQIKIGSVTRSERLAKYNRLLEIDRELQAA